MSEDEAKREDIAKGEHRANNDNKAQDGNIVKGEIVEKSEDERHVIYSVGVSCTCFSTWWKACCAM